MCLQYAIWAVAAQFHSKYDHYSEVFYKRARQYADADEMKVSSWFSRCWRQFVNRIYRARVSTSSRYRTPRRTPSLPPTKPNVCTLPGQP